MKRGLFAIAAVIIGIWVLLIVLKVAFALLGLAILAGLAFFAFLFVKNLIGGDGAR